MNPWTFIGWAVIVIAAVIVFLVAFNAAFMAVSYAVLRHRALRITPSVGQIWLCNGERLYITYIYANGNVEISDAPRGYKGTRSSWGATPENWKKRLRNSHMILLKDKP